MEMTIKEKMIKRAAPAMEGGRRGSMKMGFFCFVFFN